MSPIKNVSIPEACHQPWQQMTEVINGSHCESCCKTVTDFTTMSNEEIIRYLSVNEHVCGRFEQGQIIGINQTLLSEKNNIINLKKWGLAFVLFAFSPVVKAEKNNHFIINKSFILSHSSDTLVAKHTTVLNKKLDDNDPVIVKENIQSRNDTLRVVFGGIIVGRTIHADLWHKFKSLMKSIFY